MQTWLADEPERLDRFLATRMPDHTRSRLATAIRGGLVRVDGEAANKAGFMLKPGMRVQVEPIPASEPHNLEPVELPLDVVYEDDWLLVVDKPRGMVTHPTQSFQGPTLVHALLARPHTLSSGQAPYRPGVVHRLDRDTTGLLIVAKTDGAHASLAAQISRREVSRRYVAWVEGIPEQERFTIDAPLGPHPARRTLRAVRAEGKAARTHVRVLSTHGQRTLVTVRLETGRTHQIRVHLASCRMPVTGDKLYGSGESSGPLQLHAASLRFLHPEDGRQVGVFAPPPADFIRRELVKREDVEDWT
ncbi:MAG: RluA family pseudouridine synthase [Fimbriimonadaceae bacterium]|nr:MAG: RluA family pseudouridine synthase [Fimbriimonadaceae bacterium]